MKNKEEILKAIRENLTEEDMTKLGYSKHYIYSILIGRREKLNVLLECSEIAIKNMYAKIVLLNDFNKEMEGNEFIKFSKMSFHEQLTILSKMNTAKEINEFKKELIRLKLLDKLNEDIKPFFNDLTKTRIKDIRLLLYLRNNERK